MNMQKIRSLVLLFSLLLLPITLMYFSPVIFLMGASQGIVSGSAILFAFAFILSLFFGRIWCAWICPFGSLQDKVAVINDSRVTNPMIELVRQVIFVVWIAVFFILFAKAGGIKEINPIYETNGGLSVADPATLIVYTVIILVLTIIALILGRRGGCHLFCPISVLMSIGRKISILIRLPALRLKADQGLCNQCGRCTRICPMSLDVSSMVEKNQLEQPNCILCGSCTQKCPKKVLSLGFSRPFRKI